MIIKEYLKPKQKRGNGEKEENYILNEIIEGKEIKLYGFVLTDEEVECKFQRFWKWYKGITPVTKSKNVKESLRKFKELLLREFEVSALKKEIGALIDSVTQIK